MLATRVRVHGTSSSFNGASRVPCKQVRETRTVVVVDVVQRAAAVHPNVHDVSRPCVR